MLGFFENPKCCECGKEIKGNGITYVKLRYPKMRGTTEIKAYLKNEGTFFCEDCFNKRRE